VSNVTDRRARKKAQTRELIRSVAHRMFAERGFNTVTIADVAREADVAVQTVFNHFATKEELFFDGRVTWVDGPADAVRSRGRNVPALTALRAHLVAAVHDLVSSHSAPEHSCYIATLQASDPLRVQERELVHEAEVRLRAALLEAWTTGTARDEAVPPDPDATAPLVAATWLAATRSLIVTQRPNLTEGADPGQTATAAAERADRVLGRLEQVVELVRGRARTTAIRTDTGWPQDAVRRAG
jgi:AcrR family transcriptional regulator